MQVDIQQKPKTYVVLESGGGCFRGQELCRKVDRLGSAIFRWNYETTGQKDEISGSWLKCGQTDFGFYFRTGDGTFECDRRPGGHNLLS
jgi:hypothetical protein